MITGQLKFETPGAAAAARRVVIYVEDTSRADAAAVILARKELTIPEDFDLERDLLPFELDVPGASASLTLRAHLLSHEGADIRQGDMITMETIPAREGRPVTAVLHPIE
ncbi:hypothetical protein ACFMPD_10055 [Sedimentitalea sp. HM32M-2]|uniref:hypothetical protein n=1 Tax=Sedimentitalea sp. HM32M-2 TaxID=3351566 RepID=UPI003624E694